MRVLSRCAALKCTNNSNNSTASFFRFPTEVERAKVWLQVIRREDLLQDAARLNQSSYKVCGLHFDRTLFANAKGNRLRKNAMPQEFKVLEASTSLGAETLCKVEMYSNEEVFDDEIAEDVCSRLTQTTPMDLLRDDEQLESAVSTQTYLAEFVKNVFTQTDIVPSDPIADAPELVNVAEIKAEIDDPDLVDPAQFTDDPSVHIKVEVPDELYEPKHIPDIDTEESKIDPSCLNEVLSLVPYSETSSSDSDIVLPPIMPEKSKICRKRPQSDKSDWLAVKNKIRREKGQSYLGRIKLTDNNKWSYEKPKEPRKMKERCTCQKKEKGVMKCATISENDRKKLFDHFWAQLTWDEKRVYINNTVILVPTQRHRHRKIENQSRRSQSLSYHLRVEDDNVRKTDTALPKKRPASEQLSEENCLSKKLKTTIKKEDSTIEDSTIEDEAYVLAQSWARKYRELRPGQQLLAKKAIEDILSTAKCDALLENSVIINGGLSLPCAGTSTNL
ncbi:uncharacterized protein LOC115885660 isoform X11 [Sitophilus oryzae]|uniref:Uncharacterized protein LOC115885660 isoform X11 n=1 Tax=Sitophilus oryzae TaxID=7048 RepID=A0A6J2YCD1_SITOR|nr:uncharacterized protein LOC115885660 isoform X11 [Sitophilus oryzae]